MTAAQTRRPATLADSNHLALRNLEAQLACFYEEQFVAGGRSHGELMSTLENLETQLKDIYEEREQSGPAMSTIDAQIALKSMEEQVGALLDEKSELSEAVGSLEAQVRALLDEKAHLEQHLDALRERTRKAAHALIEQFIASP
jgi:chromosome segregation ATPase